MVGFGSVLMVMDVLISTLFHLIMFFKSKEKEKVETRTLEEIIEDRINGLGTGGTPVNEKTFNEWREKKKRQKQEQEEENEIQRRIDIRAGVVRLTGKELLMEGNGQNLDEDNDDDFDLFALRRERDEEEDALDRLNARVIEEIAYEFEGEMEPTEEEITKMLNGSENANKTETIIINDDGTTSFSLKTENTVVEIDAELFNDDNLDDIPDDV